MQDAGMYIHVPFCQRKCWYCDFYSIEDLHLKKDLLEALEREIQLDPPTKGGFSFSTLYLGGGTPSLLTPEELQRLLRVVQQEFDFTPQVEVTLEANPGTVDRHRLLAFRQAGVNRLTLGVQAFDDGALRQLTRIHRAKQAEQAVAAAREAGFDNLALDLIFAIPGQTLDTWQRTLERAVELEPSHISTYGLTYEPGTPLERDAREGKVRKINEETEREMYLLAKRLLERAGYEHYEISNFARPGYASRHNLKYWDDSPYLGFGPSAHSYDRKFRWWNVADVRSYYERLRHAQAPTERREAVTPGKRRIESIMLGLRRRTGLDLSAWEEENGTPFLELIPDVVEKLGGIDETTPPFGFSATGRLFTLLKNHLCLTIEGVLLYDSICLELVDALEKRGLI